MCRGKGGTNNKMMYGTQSLRSKLVLSIVPLFLIGELIVIGIMIARFVFGYFSLQSLTGKEILRSTV